MKQVVIMPGGFHPFHAGHAALYQSARQAFPGADVYVAATNDTSERPFPFAVKEKLAQLAGVPKGKFVQVKSPFGAEEITNRYDPETTQLIFVKSEKNSRNGPSPEGPFPAEPDPKTGQLPLVTRGARKGLPVSDRLQYYQPGQPMAPMSRHSYLAYLPTVEFGPGMTSGSQIRAAWPKLNEKRKTALIMSLYPKTQSNPKLADNAVKMLDAAMGTVDEDISRRGFLRGAGAVAAGTALGGVAQASEQPDPNKLIARVSMAGDTKEFDLTGRFKGDARSQLNQASDWLSEFLESREIDFSDFELRYQGKILKTKNTAANLGMLNRESVEKSNRRYKPVDENQGWAATYETTGGMHASYQNRYNQPTMEDYVEEDKVDPITSAAIDFYQDKVGDVHSKPVKDYREIAKKLLGQTDDPSMRKKVMDILVQGNKNPYIQGGVITTVGALLAGGILSSAAKMGLTPQQTNILLQSVLNTVIPTMVSRVNGKSWRDTLKYTLASAGIGTGIAAMTETGRKK